jgi:hypothetical protein
MSGKTYVNMTDSYPCSWDPYFYLNPNLFQIGSCSAYGDIIGGKWQVTDQEFYDKLTGDPEFIYSDEYNKRFGVISINGLTPEQYRLQNQGQATFTLTSADLNKY